MFTTATFANGSATHKIDIAFSGEQIFRSSQDGPYDLVLFGVGPSNESAQATFSTPAIVHTKYGEVPAVLTAATNSAVDVDNDGDFDFVNVAVNINVRVAENFRLCLHRRSWRRLRPGIRYAHGGPPISWLGATSVWRGRAL
ncbi:MAG: hypothetical protein AMJ56_12285 [Anaerolineae bacterium SG8_19]|nr:MAG: hypothetical protein AMJ56_12285 [Anaerolineae bacterium SG8_19]